MPIPIVHQQHSHYYHHYHHYFNHHQYFNHHHYYNHHHHHHHYHGLHGAPQIPSDHSIRDFDTQGPRSRGPSTVEDDFLSSTTEQSQAETTSPIGSEEHAMYSNSSDTQKSMNGPQHQQWIESDGMNSPPLLNTPSMKRRNAISVPIGEEHRYLSASIFSGLGVQQHCIDPTELNASCTDSSLPEKCSDAKYSRDSESIHPFDRSFSDRLEPIDHEWQHNLNPRPPYVESYSLFGGTSMLPDIEDWDLWMAEALQAIGLDGIK
ncbi:hypothetical protein BGX27_007629 [Mortierella sp. AM989]|nr:hypothetical protein BGX27_007629 [Mortierella sp. AM989]